MRPPEALTLTVSWDVLAAELERLAPAEAQKVMIPHLVSSLKKQAPFLNSDLLLRELVSTVACVSDQTFPDLAAVFGDMDRSRSSH
jgi:hypothetical protein